MSPRERRIRTRWPVPRALCLLLGVLAVLPGCRHSRQDLLEAELRTREQEIYKLRQDVQRAEMFNGSLERSIHDPAVCAPNTPGYADGPAAVMSGTVKEVVLGRGTGGMDETEAPGGGGLQVVVVPHDADGSAIKAPGVLHVEAFEVSAEGLKIPLSTWDVASLQLSKQWRNGLLSTGYFVALPWKAAPHSEKLRIVVRFNTLPDNRPFEDDRTVTIKLPYGLPRSSPIGAPEAPPFNPQANVPFNPQAMPTASPGGFPPPPEAPDPTPSQEGPVFPTNSSPGAREPAARLLAPRPLGNPLAPTIQLLKPQLPPEP